jgi:hypothetical protein
VAIPERPRAECRVTGAGRWQQRFLLSPVIVTIVGILATGIAGAAARHTEVSYWSSVNVAFLAPYSSANPNVLQVNTDSLVTTAGIVGRLVTDSDNRAQVVSDSVSLASEGISHGYSVRLPDDGGQWAINYDRPELDVQVIASTPAEVARMLHEVTRRIVSTLDAIQKAKHVDQFNTVTTTLNPQKPQVYVAEGNNKRAMLGTALLGMGFTLAAARGVAVLRRRRSIAR